MTEIRTDLNNATANGRIRASLKRADGPVAIGEIISVTDSSDSDDRFEATVLEIEDGRAVLQLHEAKLAGFTFSAAMLGRFVVFENSPMPQAGFSAAGLTTGRIHA